MFNMDKIEQAGGKTERKTKKDTRYCNKCATELKQHKTKKKYFFCEKCNCWCACWLPATGNQINKAIEKAKEKGYY
jgi:hypothetical protein